MGPLSSLVWSMSHMAPWEARDPILSLELRGAQSLTHTQRSLAFPPEGSHHPDGTWLPIGITESSLGSFQMRRRSGGKEHFLPLELEYLRGMENLRSSGHALLTALVHTCRELAVTRSICTMCIHLILTVIG